MLEVPLQTLPWQRSSITLADQPCRISVRQRLFGLFFDLYVNDVLLVAGVLCQNDNLLVRSSYLPFLGDLAFTDTQGTDDPVYTGLGDRWRLLYFEASELHGP